jgi:hypothetical protein
MMINCDCYARDHEYMTRSLLYQDLLLNCIDREFCHNKNDCFVFWSFWPNTAQETDYSGKISCKCHYPFSQECAFNIILNRPCPLLSASS